MKQNSEKTPLIQPGMMLGFLMLSSCFALWGLLNTMTDNLVPAFAKIFMLNAEISVMVQVAFYGAYSVLAIPAALLIKKYSYRHGILIGLGFYVIGAMGYIPAAAMQNYGIFLVSIFILAGGLSVLETTCNPFVLALGDKKTAIQRLNFAQAFNPVGLITGLILGKYIILSRLNDASIEERAAMTPDALNSIRNSELFWLSVPYISLVIIAVCIWCYFLKQKIELKDEGEEIGLKENFRKLLTNKNYTFGVIAQFFYVGVQTAVWTWTVKYVVILNNVNEATAVQVSLWAIGFFIVMRWVCTALMRFMQPALLMLGFTALALALSFGVIYFPPSLSIPCLVGLSGCMSLMFPTIYGLALDGLPSSEVKLGAAGLIMAIGGGALLSYLMGLLIDSGAASFLTPMYSGAEACIRSSFIIATIAYIIIGAYPLYMMLRENRNK